MSSHVLDLFRAVRPRRPRLARQARRFGRRQDGATVIEFAIVVFPFLAILFAIIEIALVFFAGQVLETATADTARRIMTGEAQNSGMTAAQFKNDLCGRLQALFNCQSGVRIDIRKYGSFSGVSIAPPLDQDGNLALDPNNPVFEPGTQGDIVVVRVAYEWPVFVRDFGFNLATLPNGKRLLMATAAFKNEPYKNH